MKNCFSVGPKLGGLGERFGGGGVDEVVGAVAECAGGKLVFNEVMEGGLAVVVEEGGIDGVVEPVSEDLVGSDDRRKGQVWCKEGLEWLRLRWVLNIWSMVGLERG